MLKKIEIEGVAAANKMLEQVAKECDFDLAKIVTDAALMTHSNAVISIQTGSRSGEVYERGGKTAQRSAEGEAPKTDTGNLVANITLQAGATVYVKGMAGGNPQVPKDKVLGGLTVGSRKGAPHGFWLEFGTSKMGARPWLQPAFDKMKKDFLIPLAQKFKGGRYK